MAKKVAKKSSKSAAKRPAARAARKSSKKASAPKPKKSASQPAGTPSKLTAKKATTAKAGAAKTTRSKVKPSTAKAAKIAAPKHSEASKSKAAPTAKPTKAVAAKVMKEPASAATRPLAPGKRPASAAVEAKPSTKPPTRSGAVDLPLYPIAPASGQRDVDLATAIQKSRMFFATHGLGALASAIPTASDFPQEAHAAIEDAHAVGLDDVFVFPPVALQRTSLDHLVHKLAAAHCDRLESDRQYSPPWIYQPEALKTFDVLGRPAGAYALCFHSSPFATATLGKDADELREWLTRRRSASLTAYEYLVLQRLRAEQHADHRFDLNAKTPTSQWHWLLDMSLGHGKDAKVPMAGWNPKLRRIDLGWCGPRDTDRAKGTVATRIVPALVAAPASATPPQPTL